MPYLRRRALFTLFALIVLAAPLTVLAQDDAIRVDGSRIVADIIAPVSEALESTISLEISGTSNGLARLCSGEIDIANAARPMTSGEIEACAANGVEWVEVPVGYDALAVIANPAISAAQCMTVNELATLFGPGATGVVTTLNQVNTRWGTAAVTAYAPAADSAAYSLLESILPGDGLRSDFNTPEDVAALISAVAEDETAVGFAPLSAMLGSDSAVNILGIDNLSGNGCVSPDQATLADGTYAAANGLYLYVSAAGLEREDVQALVNEVIGETGQAAVTDAGFVALPEDFSAAAATNVAEVVTGRQFSQPEPLYTVALDVTGSVAVESAAAAYRAINAVTSALSTTYTGVTTNVNGFGNVTAYQNLCNGVADAAAVTRPATAEEAALCEENGISLWEAPLGARALVMVVPEAAEFAACLTTDEVATLWRAEGGVAAANWNAINPDFPDLPITVFLPSNANNQTDFLLSTVSATLADTRRDALEQRNDALWRAAATANVEGSVTYMLLDEFQASDAAVRAVAVDASDGCVEPSTATILDGSYAVSQPVNLVFRQAALARPEVQALAWFITRSTTPALLEGADLVSVPAEELAAHQPELVEAFAAAETLAAETPAEEAAPEATPADAESTPEASN